MIREIGHFALMPALPVALVQSVVPRDVGRHGVVVMIARVQE
jgi:cytochrome c biogenesis factor